MQTGQPFTTIAGIRLVLTGETREKHEKIKGITDLEVVWNETEGN